MLSNADQVAVQAALEHAKSEGKGGRSSGLKHTYTSTGVRFRARLDDFHGQPVSTVIKKYCERAHHSFDDRAHKRLHSISESHLYNL